MNNRRPTIQKGLTRKRRSIQDNRSMQKEAVAASRGAPAAVNRRIGQRVRCLRRQQALSLDALAALSGVSRSMLSLVERAECSPTAVVLDKVAVALGVPLATLFEPPVADPSPVSRGAGREAWRDPESGYVRRNLTAPGIRSPIRLVEVVLPPGAHVAYENGAGAALMYQQLWVLEGALQVASGGERYDLEADDCLAMQLDVPTAFHNPNRSPARYLLAVAAFAPAAPARWRETGDGRGAQLPS